MSTWGLTFRHHSVSIVMPTSLACDGTVNNSYILTFRSLWPSALALKISAWSLARNMTACTWLPWICRPGENILWSGRHKFTSIYLWPHLYIVCAWCLRLPGLKDCVSWWMCFACLVLPITWFFFPNVWGLATLTKLNTEMHIFRTKFGITTLILWLCHQRPGHNRQNWKMRSYNKI